MEDHNDDNKSSKRGIIRKVALTFLIVGSIGWFIPFSDILNYQWLELPNSFPEGLYVDDNGNIFCGSSTYERIQMYDKHGTFVRAFDTDVGKGRGSLFTFKVENNQLHIHVFGAWQKLERLDRKIVYSLDGNLLQAIDFPSSEYVGYNVNNQVQDSLGNYYIFKGLLFPRVIKKAKEDSSIIIGTPIYFWLFQSPVPAFAFFFISVIFLMKYGPIIQRRKSHKLVNTQEIPISNYD